MIGGQSTINQQQNLSSSVLSASQFAQTVKQASVSSVRSGGQHPSQQSKVYKALMNLL